MLNKRGESGHPCFVPDFKGNACSFCPLSMMLAVGLSYMAFILFKFIPSISILLRVFFFIINGCWILSNAFFCIYWYDHVVFILHSVYVVNHSYRSVNVVLYIVKFLVLSGWMSFIQHKQQGILILVVIMSASVTVVHRPMALFLISWLL